MDSGKTLAADTVKIAMPTAARLRKLDRYEALVNLQIGSTMKRLRKVHSLTNCNYSAHSA